MRTGNELLRELQRLNKTGIINDEEYVVLRKIIAGGKVSPELYRHFDRLFAANSKTTDLTEIGAPEKKEAPVKKSERLYSFNEALDELNLNLLTRGGLDRSRELLTCPACGMFEDITDQGKLITAEADYPADDTGLRFTKVGEDEWECPDCGHLCREKSSG